MPNLPHSIDRVLRPAQTHAHAVVGGEFLPAREAAGIRLRQVHVAQRIGIRGVARVQMGVPPSARRVQVGVPSAIVFI